MKRDPNERLSIKSQKPTFPQWRTADGRIMAIADMDDTHLENSILMLERKGLAAALKYLEMRVADPFFDPQTAPDEDVVAYMEGQMVGAKDRLIATYQGLLVSRADRIKRGTWSPRTEKGDGPLPRPRGTKK